MSEIKKTESNQLKKIIKPEARCQNCKFHNQEKISCSHYLWNSCVVRDEKNYVIRYNYHQFQ